ncbi:putative isoamyl alcohol oxidase [Whalleya microplaca]|nr:putative isoamyl alcohol oxidase [Whalleya microplaca]
MAFRQALQVGLVGFLSLAAFSRATPFSTNTSTSTNSTSSNCKVIPGDANWPSQGEWNSLNKTVGGRLIATQLLGSICHEEAVGTAALGPHNETACAVLRENYDLEETHQDWSAEVLNPYWQGDSCSPWTSPDQPCELGKYVSYAINISTTGDPVGDIGAGMEFAKKHNIRLVVKNTGHDFLGRSTGTGALSLWMHNLQGQNMTKNFQSGDYNGPAVTLKAGTQGYQAYEYMNQEGYRVVGGECPTVGIAGGYTTSGGHSLLSSTYGMAADSVLEWEVVTPQGEHVWATPRGDYADLYWALSGGGGSTWGVILSLTTKVYQEGIVGAGNFSFNASGISSETYWAAVANVYAFMPNFTDAGGTFTWGQTNTSFQSFSITMPDKNADTVTATWAPLLKELDAMSVPYTFEARTDPTYYQHVALDEGPLPYGNETNDATTLINSRLVPRSLVSDPSSNESKAFHEAIKNVTTVQDGRYEWGCIAVSTGKWKDNNNAVFPGWRDTMGICVIEAAWLRTIPYEEMLEFKEYTTSVMVPYMEAATPGGSVYINEIDPLYQGDWKTEGYGDTYDRLLSIKNKYDPDHLFWSYFSIGGDEYTTDQAGRVCKA